MAMMEFAKYKKSVFHEDYPKNLLLIVQREAKSRGFEISPDDLTHDRHAGLEYALSTLSDREQKILRMRYAEHKSFIDISKESGISDRGASSIEATAVYKLCKAPLLGYLQYGKNAYEEMVRKQEAEQMKKGFSEEVLNTPISKLDLSIRSENILLCAGFVTVRDIAYLSEEQLLGIKKLKKPSGCEIAQKLRYLGVLHTKWERFFDADFTTPYDKEKKRPKPDREKVKALIEQSFQKMINDPETDMTAEQVQKEYGVLTSDKGLDILMELLTAVSEGKTK